MAGAFASRSVSLWPSVMLSALFSVHFNMVFLRSG